MQLTTSSILNVSVISGMAVLLLWLILSSQRILNRLAFGVLSGCLGILFVRILLPVEYGFTITIPVKHILPKIRRFFDIPVLSVFGYEICIEHLIYLIWMTGSLLFGILALKGLFALRRSVKAGMPTDDPDIQAALAVVLEKHKKKKEFRVIQAKDVETPMIFGIRKPCIFLPEVKLSVQEWQYILEHETAHYYHGDLYIKYLLTLFTVLYWWNPFVHILNSQVSKVLELRTDNTVIQSKSEAERLDYASCLLRMSKRRLEKQRAKDTFAISFIGFKKFSMSQRFYFVTAEPNEKKGRIRANLVVLPMLIFTLFSFCFIFEPYSIKPEDAEGTVELTPENAYFIKNKDGSYDIYYEDKYWVTSSSVDIGVELPVYNSKEDVP